MAGKQQFILFLISSISLFMPGCSVLGIGQSDFSCPGGIERTRCLSARQVYQATEASSYVKTTSELADDQVPVTPQENFESIGRVNVAVPSIEQPLPIRTQAKVMRIWVAPWEDEEGDLHADGYLYTEIEKRRWNLGARFKAPGQTFAPL